MTAEELLKNSMFYHRKFSKDPSLPPDRAVPYDIAQAAVQMKELEAKADTNNGWICPKCGRVYAPNISMCNYCYNKSVANINRALDSDIMRVSKSLGSNHPTYPIDQSFNGISYESKGK